MKTVQSTESLFSRDRLCSGEKPRVMRDFLSVSRGRSARGVDRSPCKSAYRDASFRSTRGFSRISRTAFSCDTHGQWQVPIFETSVCARACNDEEEEQVFHFSPAYRPTLTSSSSIPRMSGVRWKKGRTKSEPREPRTENRGEREVEKDRGRRATIRPWMNSKKREGKEERIEVCGTSFAASSRCATWTMKKVTLPRVDATRTCGNQFPFFD